MIELPPLPDDPGLRMIEPKDSLYNADQMRSYGEACARVAVEAAARECERIHDGYHVLPDGAEAIRALKVTP
jgi:hypothetical protein